MPRRSTSLLRAPDLPGWRAEPNYSPTVARALITAYEYLARFPNSMPAALKVHAIAFSHRRWPMSVRQRMTLHYVLAQSAAEMGEGHIAFQMLDCALEQSVLLQDRRATAELLYYAGALKRAFMRASDALADLHASYNIINDLKESRFAIGADLERDVATAIGVTHCFQARYGEAERWLDEARRLHSLTPGAQWEGHLIDWGSALVYRYRGEPIRAAPILDRIAGDIETMTTPGSFARIHTALADVALDLAETALARGDERAAGPLLAGAYAHANAGEAKGEEAFDDGGAMLARLAIVRFSQLTHSNFDRQGFIDDAIAFSEATDQLAVLALARTALAQEMLAQGRMEAARDLLRMVITTSAASDVPFTGEAAKASLRAIDGYEDW